MIYITTKAYNAEKTLSKTIESVLGQTFGDFVYYVCDNGSNDGTGDIIQHYSNLDKRIVPIKQYPNDYYDYDKNGLWGKDLERYIVRLMFYINPDDWYVHIDADDDYEKTFLSEMLRFAECENLDIVACRSNYIKEPEGIVDNKYIISENLIIENEKFGTLFPVYYRFMGSQWAKLHSGRVFKRINRTDFELWMSKRAFDVKGDTAMELFFLRFSDRLGVLAKALHNYHIYPKSFARQNINLHIDDNNKTPDLYREFLTNKIGYVSDENERCIEDLYKRFAERLNKEIDLK